MLFTDIVLICQASLLGIIFIYAIVISLIENEKRAALISLFAGIVVTAPLLFLFLFSERIVPVTQWAIPLLYLAVAVFFFYPFNYGSQTIRATPTKKYDERDIMFSRRLLIPGSDKYINYYKSNPEKEKIDDIFRARPGLLQKGSAFYNPLLFNAANAGFATVEAFHPIVDGPVSAEKVDVSKSEINCFIKNWAKILGAKDIGFTYLKDYHKYSVIGRGKDYGKTVDLDHKFAIALTVEMDKTLIDTAPQAPVTLETSHKYLKSGEVAVQLAVFIRSLGYEARAHIDGNYRVICPLVAKDAGLGNIGRMGLLMTPRQGPRVRIAVVTTNLPLTIDQSKPDESVNAFCSICKKCADTCPGKAIPDGEEQEIDGVKRWQINQEKCFTFWCQAGTDCGRCIAVCPYSHPDNLFHNIVRYGIKYNPFFRRIAAKLDDVFYGRKPKIKKMPGKISYKIINKP